MPEEFLTSVFDFSKIEVGMPIKTTVVDKNIDIYGYVTAVNPKSVEIGVYNGTTPVFCEVKAEHLLEEIVRIEVL